MRTIYTLTICAAAVAARSLAPPARGPADSRSADGAPPLAHEGDTRTAVSLRPDSSDTPPSAWADAPAGGFCSGVDADPWFDRSVPCPEHPNAELVPVSDRGIASFRAAPLWAYELADEGILPEHLLPGVEGVGEPDPLGIAPSRFCCPVDGRIWTTAIDGLEVSP